MLAWSLPAFSLDVQLLLETAAALLLPVPESVLFDDLINMLFCQEPFADSNTDVGW